MNILTTIKYIAIIFIIFFSSVFLILFAHELNNEIHKSDTEVIIEKGE